MTRSVGGDADRGSRSSASAAIQATRRSAGLSFDASWRAPAGAVCAPVLRSHSIGRPLPGERRTVGRRNGAATVTGGPGRNPEPADVASPPPGRPLGPSLPPGPPPPPPRLAGRRSPVVGAGQDSAGRRRPRRSRSAGRSRPPRTPRTAPAPSSSALAAGTCGRPGASSSRPRPAARRCGHRRPIPRGTCRAGCLPGPHPRASGSSGSRALPTRRRGSHDARGAGTSSGSNGEAMTSPLPSAASGPALTCRPSGRSSPQTKQPASGWSTAKLGCRRRAAVAAARLGRAGGSGRSMDAVVPVATSWVAAPQGRARVPAGPVGKPSSAAPRAAQAGAAGRRPARAGSRAPRRRRRTRSRRLRCWAAR